ncbi:hypothetical protein F0562_022417 [Nyssa sinensis]|uniref:SHSP domain-containing protein n=1 Tax=Nyssa sinensis TaxID=561372 RepID=A0A5J5BMQ4_9ASTE|nr:hypothetical protein F0562_022417 [Nyssa sinensis]
MEDGKQQAVSTREYVDFEPSIDWSFEEDCDTLLLNLPGFKKEHLRVQLLPTRTLKISGERQVRNNKWSRFVKDFLLSEHCNVDKITAIYTDGVLYVKQPKIITPEAKEDEEKPSSEAPQPQELPDDEPRPQQTVQDQQHIQKSTTSMTENTNNVPEKVPEKKGLSNADENATFTTRKTSEKYENLGDAVKDATKTESGNANNIVEDGGKTEPENYEQPLAGLRKSRVFMNLVLVILAALVLGIYVTNLIKSSKQS